MHDPDSLLAFIRGLAARYRSSPEIGWGRFEVLPSRPGRRARAPHHGGRRPLRGLHNFAPTPTVVPLELGRGRARLELSDLLPSARFDLDDRGRVDVQLDAYGYRWFRIVEPDDRRLT